MDINFTSASFLLDTHLQDLMKNRSTDNGRYLESNTGLQMFFAVILSFSAAMGIFGNILIILTVVLTKTLRTPSNTFIVNLAVADLVVTTVVDPFNVIGAFVGHEYFKENYTLCQMIASLCAPACLCSMFSICAISINRYILICHYHHYERIFTWRKTELMCLFLWLLSYAMHFPNHVGWGHNDFDPVFYICTFSTATHSYAIFYITAGVFIPLVVVLFNYASIFFRHWKVKRSIRKHRNIALELHTIPSMTNVQHVAKQKSLQVPLLHRSKSAHMISLESPIGSGPSFLRLQQAKSGFTNDDIKLAKTLFTVFVAFLVCWSPFSLLVLMKQPPSIPGWIYMIAIIMAHGNSSINSILYGLTNKRFRQGYRAVLGIQNQSNLKGVTKINIKLDKSFQQRKMCHISPTLAGVYGGSVSPSELGKVPGNSEQNGAVFIKKIIKATPKMDKRRKKKATTIESSASDQLLSPNGVIMIIPASP